MPSRWTKKEEDFHRKELLFLYVKQNKTIREVGNVLGISEQTVFGRLRRLDIKSQPHLKENYLKQRGDVRLPRRYSNDLAEFFGIMLGDGHISHFQVVVTLGTKELHYVDYVKSFIEKIFKTKAKIGIRADGYRDVYVGSTKITGWLFKEGLMSNKVKSQVDIPDWIFTKPEYMKRFLRGFFDTDGSVYKLRFGIQISLTNHSVPILVSLRKALFKLGYNPSEISAHKIYLTRVPDVKRFFKEIQPRNQKHQRRFEEFILMRRSDSGHSSAL